MLDLTMRVRTTDGDSRLVFIVEQKGTEISTGPLTRDEARGLAGVLAGIRDELMQHYRPKVVTTTCIRCGHAQKTIKPWKHIPRCGNCRKPMRPTDEEES